MRTNLQVTRLIEHHKLVIRIKDQAQIVKILQQVCAARSIEHLPSSAPTKAETVHIHSRQ